MSRERGAGSVEPEDFSELGPFSFLEPKCRGAAWSLEPERVKKTELLRGDLFDHGEEVVEKTVPGFYLAEAGALEFGVGRVVRDDGAERVEVAIGVIEVRFDTQAQETVGQAPEVEFGLEVFLAHAGQEYALDRAELTEPFETLERAAAAGPEQGHDFIEVKRTRGGEKQAVDLADGTREREGAGGSNEERDGLLLKGAQSGTSRFRPSPAG